MWNVESRKLKLRWPFSGVGGGIGAAGADGGGGDVGILFFEDIEV